MFLFFVDFTCSSVRLGLQISTETILLLMIFRSLKAVYLKVACVIFSLKVPCTYSIIVMWIYSALSFICDTEISCNLMSTFEDIPLFNLKQIA